MKRWGDDKLHGYAVFTSNIDGQFQKAGFEQAVIEECHGSIHYLQCLSLCCNDIWSVDGLAPEVDADQCLLLGAIPTCPHCGGMARPNVMMFNDWDWQEHRQALQTARMERWLSGVSRPVVVEIGAGTAIPSVRRFSQRIIHGFGGRLVRINPRESQVPSSNDVGIDMGSLEALKGIERSMGSFD